jgi:polar amino acid transport system substrate-binding protein
LFIAFSPKEPKAKIYANILAKETKEMRKSGELKKILATYNLTDWQK